MFFYEKMKQIAFINKLLLEKKDSKRALAVPKKLPCYFVLFVWEGVKE